MDKPGKDSSVSFYGSKEGNDISVLLECKTVIEKKDFVAAGTLTYAHGDIIEIELPQCGNFDLKESVKIIIYTRNGMFVFETMVVARSDDSLVVINPPENRRKFVDKREHPRVDVRHQGSLHSIHDRTGLKAMEEPIPLTVSNVSLNGAGFVLGYDLGVAPGTALAVELDLGFPLAVKAEVVRKVKTEQGFFYGTRFDAVPAELTNTLRAFVLRKQVEDYFLKKKTARQNELLEGKTAANG